MTRQFLKQHGCKTEKDFWNLILQDYFNEEYQAAFLKLKEISNDREDFFWTYANSRLITRKDSENIAALMYHANN